MHDSLTYNIKLQTTVAAILVASVGLALMIRVLELIVSSRTIRVERTPPSVPERFVRVPFDGWAFPRSGVGFAWVTTSRDAKPLR
ncbi:Uncharacterised protein [Mycobacteroides abscessus subsp. massiliense]|nr:Uncharacterised protein [Mycobacteroides abscessus subsp. massiliense]SKI14447.1 Uncharacterised protein [Mycobacteroides abscessus subsp. massiliense]SKL97004.1 Uncharacterised protein [Mycobacteroides abscessus subsp. massiliense]SKM69029.1 Uncharacterised protein [Mycobacteroides abscessus subsp. massiliense]SKN53685.1 Uncharacterised protein [Mycobacteroides abscessus subsp. massiliense]